MNQIRSMWDRIFECPIPVNSLAAIVVFARSESVLNLEDARPQAKESLQAFGFSDYVDITTEPPEGLIDYRGRRSFYHVVVGYAHRKARRKKTGKANSTTTWYVLRADGEVLLVNNESMRKRLKNMDDAYLRDIDQGFSKGVSSEEWFKVSQIPISQTPCANNLSH